MSVKAIGELLSKYGEWVAKLELRVMELETELHNLKYHTVTLLEAKIETLEEMLVVADSPSPDPDEVFDG